MFQRYIWLQVANRIPCICYLFNHFKNLSIMKTQIKKLENEIRQLTGRSFYCALNAEEQKKLDSLKYKLYILKKSCPVS